mgnify:FL=1
MSRRHVLIIGSIGLCALWGAGLLVARIARLETRLAALESRSHVVYRAHRPSVAEVALPPTPLGAWSQREFNGQLVYVVPLAKE